ncbi:MAG: transglutaminase domain-containing protein [Candidatus Limnocylindrales bacterium]|jgi:hypothetical protein
MTAGSQRQAPVADLRPRDWDEDYGEFGSLGALLARFRPDEGWLGIVLVLVMAGTMAWSIADARWILGRDELTSFVIWIALAATLWGYLSSRLGIAPWIAHVIGAALGAFVLIEVVGSLMPDANPSLGGWFQATAQSVAQAYLDLTWRHKISTLQYGHFCLIIGIVVWGTAQAASYDVFGYHRAINGVLLMAFVLLANMAVTAADANGQFLDLVVFSSAGLWLLVRAHAADVRSSWRRHRIWRGADLTASHAQGGVGFASLTICGALILTSVASSAPLQSLWPGVQDNLRGFETWISAYLPAGGQSRFSQGADFGSSTTIASSFQGSSSLVFTISDLPASASSSHWRVISYDTFESTGWTTGAGSQSSFQAGVGLNDGTLDQVSADTPGRSPYSYVINVRDSSLQHLVVANEPVSASVPVTRILVGGSPSLSDVVWFATNATTYTVISLMPDVDPNGTGLTAWRLRQAGTNYPTGLLARYTQGAGLVGDYGQTLLRSIELWAASRGVAVDSGGHFTNAYDAANAIQDYLRDPEHFTYDPNITALVSRCASLSTVDCFARYRIGFCEQYATTMTMLMRMEGFPARYVEGYLSGKLDEATRAILVTGQQRHAWVEVYFPGYGWIPFDPTGGPVGQPTQLPAGSPAASSPSPSPSPVEPGQTGDQDVKPHRTSGGSTSIPTASTGGQGGLLLAAVISLVVLLALVLLWRRRPRRLQSSDTVYRSIVRLASRLGYEPLPTQTIYEYTGMLAEVVPRARVPLDVVAKAQVEVTYGRRQLPVDRLIVLAGAQRLVRQALLRLALRVPRVGPWRTGKDRQPPR